MEHLARATRAWLLAGLAVAAAAGPARAGEFFIAPWGHDTNAGDRADAPLATIQLAADAASPGDTIWLRGGLYRQDIYATNCYGTPGNRTTFAAYSNETPIISACDVVTNFQHWGNAIWVATNHYPDPQLVFVDAVSLQRIGHLNPWMPAHRYTRVGTDETDMTAGSFFYDSNDASLYVWLPDGSDPTGSLVEASTRTFCFYALSTNTQAWLHLDGITFRHSNTCTVTNGWPAVLTGGNSIMEDCRIEWVDFTGFTLGATSHAYRCTFAHCGNKAGGFGLNGGLHDCTIVSNNTRGFNWSWTGGGLKFIPDVYGTVENCEVGWNGGPGIWFDSCATGLPIVIRNNYVHHNAAAGIFVEISDRAEVTGNLLVSNATRSIHVAGSTRVDIHHNTIVANDDWMAVEMSFSPTRTNSAGELYPLASNRFVNNIVYQTVRVSDLVMREEDGSNVFANVSDYNCYYRSSAPGTARFSLNRPGSGIGTTSLTEWVEWTGWDRHSIAVDPRFVDGGRDGYHLASAAGTVSNGLVVTSAVSSLCIDAADPAAAFTHEPPWNGGRANLGRHGNSDEAARSPDADDDDLSDVIELRDTGTSTSERDTDDDGAGDRHEYIAGTGGTDESNRFDVAMTTNASPRGLRLAWYGVAGRRYAVITSTDAVLAAWSTRAGLLDDHGAPLPHPVRGTNGWISALDTNAFDVPYRAYRVEAAWP